jgi:hypothetical protein
MSRVRLRGGGVGDVGVDDWMGFRRMILSN